MKTCIKKIMIEHIIESKKILRDEFICQAIENAYTAIINCYQNKGKILICGNGGSAADSAHFTAELAGRFKRNRIPLAAIDLTAETGVLTAISNDYDFMQVYSRQIEALMNPGDILIALSTSGNSQNIINAVSQAKTNNGYIICFLGNSNSKLKGAADTEIIIPCTTTARIQELHILIIHIICELLDIYFANII